MDFDPQDLIDANLSLLTEAANLQEPEQALLMTVATWGRGADPEQLKALQPFRHGLGFNGSVVARVPMDWAAEWIPEVAFHQVQAAEFRPVVYSAVFKDWFVGPLP
jgi:hypothetical protein